ncbi:MAG: Tat pathway signal protein [Halanaeroarchaeum sp.]
MQSGGSADDPYHATDGADGDPAPADRSDEDCASPERFHGDHARADGEHARAEPSDDPVASRRSFLKAAVAVGGAVGLAACLGERGRPDLPRGPASLSMLPERQHAWNAVLATDEAGNVVPPRHRVLLTLSLPGEGPPTEDQRTTVESALRTLEHAYPRTHRGLLFTVGYSPYYFDRFEASLPPSVDLPAPGALAPFEDPAPDDADVMVHLASDVPAAVITAGQALRGTIDSLNGVPVTHALTEVLSVEDRRTGFVGSGLPADHEAVTDVADGTIPTAAPLYMGFKSSFAENQASEAQVTIDEGPFSPGTTQHVSRIDLDLERWYEQDDRYQRVAKMFCPHHAEADAVEGVGANLGTSSGMTSCGRPTEAARESGVVGHSQKMVSAREDGDPIILRRDFDTTDGDRPGLHFLALQAGIEDFETTRRAMNGTEVAEESAVGTRTNNGILQYMAVRRRGNFLLPPRSLRALPPADP